MFFFLNVHYVCVFLCITVSISCTIVIKLCNLGAALRALTEPCMSGSPIVHCHFMLLFMNE